MLEPKLARWTGTYTVRSAPTREPLTVNEPKRVDNWVTPFLQSVHQRTCIQPRMPREPSLFPFNSRGRATKSRYRNGLLLPMCTVSRSQGHMRALGYKEGERYTSPLAEMNSKTKGKTERDTMNHRVVKLREDPFSGDLRLHTAMLKDHSFPLTPNSPNAKTEARENRQEGRSSSRFGDKWSAHRRRVSGPAVMDGLG